MKGNSHWEGPSSEDQVKRWRVQEERKEQKWKKKKKKKKKGEVPKKEMVGKVQREYREHHYDEEERG